MIVHRFVQSLLWSFTLYDILPLLVVITLKSYIGEYFTAFLQALLGSLTLLDMSPYFAFITRKPYIVGYFTVFRIYYTEALHCWICHRILQLLHGSLTL